MMTTMAALLGGVPLMLSHGTGSEMRQPLGYTMVGGLIVSQALTLFTTPVIYLYLDRLSHWLSGSRAKPTASEAEPEPAWIAEKARARRSQAERAPQVRNHHPPIVGRRSTRRSPGAAAHLPPSDASGQLRIGVKWRRRSPRMSAATNAPAP